MLPRDWYRTFICELSIPNSSKFEKLKITKPALKSFRCTGFFFSEPVLEVDSGKLRKITWAQNRATSTFYDFVSD